MLDLFLKRLVPFNAGQRYSKFEGVRKWKQ